MKRIFLAIIMAVVSVGAFAQFEKGTKYVNTSLSGLQMQYSKNSKFSMGLDANAGYFVVNELAIMGRVGYNHQFGGKTATTNTFDFGAAARYYIRQNGLFLQCGLLYENNRTGCCWKHGAKLNNIFLTPEVGYCFYVNHFISIEPSVYYDLSMNHFSDCSRVGLRVAAGFYF